MFTLVAFCFQSTPCKTTRVTRRAIAQHRVEPASEEDAVVSPTPPSGTGTAERLGLKPGMIVMESGYDDDVDEQFREDIVATVGDEMVDEDTDEVVDVVLLWYRDGDEDLADILVDSISPLADDGVIWLLTPKRGRDNYVEPSDIAEAASIAGLSQTSIATAGPDWTAARLVGRRSSGGKR